MTTHPDVMTEKSTMQAAETIRFSVLVIASSPAELSASCVTESHPHTPKKPPKKTTQSQASTRTSPGEIERGRGPWPVSDEKGWGPATAAVAAVAA